MLTFLFWNVHKGQITDAIGRLVTQHSIDVLVLAENEHPLAGPAAVVRHLNERTQGNPPFRFFDSQCERVQIFTRMGRDAISVMHDDDRYTIREIRLPGRASIFLVAVHLVSALFSNEKDQYSEAEQLAQEIRRVEDAAGHRRTVLCGDLNTDPFADGIVSATGLHAVMTRRIAQRGQRLVRGRAHPFFYNPMWSHFGERAEGPPGTYFYDRGGNICHFWHIFDQVLVRPDLIPFWDEQELRVLTGDGTVSYISDQGIPGLSDHLPLIFRLNL